MQVKHCVDGTVVGYERQTRANGIEEGTGASKKAETPAGQVYGTALGR